VLALNTPMFNRFGTVGKLLPGIEPRLEPVPGIDDAGRLYVRGPNVMLGYLRAEQPGVLDAPPEGWHDTCDIVSFDAQGFMTIRGRAIAPPPLPSPRLPTNARASAWCC
jgi:acyl-[acyl-carrier-protein]-phospholipid O-acyltransferase/long-chain-fatty-acid--[acyl-carrier-protein] ligase